MNAAMTRHSDERTVCGGGLLHDDAPLEPTAPHWCGGDPLANLLRTLSDTQDIRPSLSQVARAANRVISHDCLELVVHDHAGRVLLQIRSTEGLPFTHQVTPAGDDDYCIVADLRDGQARRAGLTADGSVACLVSAGYRSLLRVSTRARQRVVRLGFLSKEVETYTVEDVALARQIAAGLAVVVSHDGLASPDGEHASTRDRAGNTEKRAHSAGDMVDRIRCGGEAVGNSAGWRKVLMRAAQVAATETTVFLHGESGTGKEVVARFIHGASRRCAGPFVAINCAALPDQLLESELFGYERGAFTGAYQAKQGQIELAAAGVLFLDEVSEMSPAAQAKLLRFLQEREFQRVGGTRLIKANVRVIAASNRDLRESVKSGTFRTDLFYRLQVFDISLPPLRERPTDIPLLAEAFLRELSRSLARASLILTPSAVDRLLAHPWPGNVRELHNALERAAILAEGESIEAEHLPPDLPVATVDPGSDLRAAERQTIERVLNETDWNKAKAARRLGITRSQLYGRLRKYGLEGSLLPPAR
jgi:transcriptional regulator with GAF, ATPase, and Fis domain